MLVGESVPVYIDGYVMFIQSRCEHSVHFI